LDPDEIVTRNPDEWAELIKKSKHIITHVIDTLVVEKNLDDPKVKSEIASQVLPLIEDIANPIERDSYRQQLARIIRVDERALATTRNVSPVTRKRRHIPEEIKPPPPQAHGVAKPDQDTLLEKYILGSLLRDPELIYRLDRELQINSLNAVGADDFPGTDYHSLFDVIHKAIDQAQIDPSQYIVENLPEGLVSLANEIRTPIDKTDFQKLRHVEELQRGVIRLRRNLVNDSLLQLRFLQEETQSNEDWRNLPYQSLVIQYTQMRDKLDRALGNTRIRES
jgi:DNA primase